MRALLDTSVFVAREQRRPLSELPDEVAVSVVTISELRYGVLAAADHETRAVRLSTLEVARRMGGPLAIDDRVGSELARLRIALEAAGREGTRRGRGRVDARRLAARPSSSRSPSGAARTRATATSERSGTAAGGQECALRG